MKKQTKPTTPAKAKTAKAQAEFSNQKAADVALRASGLFSEHNQSNYAGGKRELSLVGGKGFKPLPAGHFAVVRQGLVRPDKAGLFVAESAPSGANPFKLAGVKRALWRKFAVAYVEKTTSGKNHHCAMQTAKGFEMHEFAESFPQHKGGSNVILRKEVKF